MHLEDSHESQPLHSYQSEDPVDATFSLHPISGPVTPVLGQHSPDVIGEDSRTVRCCQGSDNLFEAITRYFYIAPSDLHHFDESTCVDEVPQALAHLTQPHNTDHTT